MSASARPTNPFLPRTLGTSRLAPLALALIVAAGCDTSVQALGETDMTLIATELPVPVAPDNPVVCPEQPNEAMLAEPTSGRASCSDVAAGTSCIYAIPNGWAAYVCGCFEDDVWQHYSLTGPGECPAELPVEGSSCDESVALGPCVYYPTYHATCDDGAWRIFMNSDEQFYCTNLDAYIPGSADVFGI